MSETLLDTSTEETGTALTGRFFETYFPPQEEESLLEFSLRFYEQYGDLMPNGCAVVSQTADTKVVNFFMPNPELALENIKRVKQGLEPLPKLLDQKVVLMTSPIRTVAFDASKYPTEKAFIWQIEDCQEHVSTVKCKTGLDALDKNGKRINPSGTKERDEWEVPGIISSSRRIIQIKIGEGQEWPVRFFELDAQGSIKKEGCLLPDEGSEFLAELISMLDGDGEIAAEVKDRVEKTLRAEENYEEYIQKKQKDTADFTKTVLATLAIYSELIPENAVLTDEQANTIENLQNAPCLRDKRNRIKIAKRREHVDQIGFVAGQIFERPAQATRKTSPIKNFDEIDWEKTKGRLPLGLVSATQKKESSEPSSEETENDSVDIDAIKSDPNQLTLPFEVNEEFRRSNGANLLEDFELKNTKELKINRFGLFRDYRSLKSTLSNYRKAKGLNEALKSLEPSQQIENKLALMALTSQKLLMNLHGIFMESNLLGRSGNCLPHGLYRLGKNIYKRDRKGFYVVSPNVQGALVYKTLASFKGDQVKWQLQANLFLDLSYDILAASAES